MDRYERFYRRTLRDVLVGQGVLTPEQADELAESAYEENESFGHAIVDAGHLTSWELARMVASHYQMPVIPLRGFEFDTDMLEGISSTALYQYQVLPIGRFGKSWSFAVIEPPTRDCVGALRDAFGSAIFFFVAEAELVKDLVGEHVKVVDAAADKNWQSLFDAADAKIHTELDGDELDDEEQDSEPIDLDAAQN